MVQMRDCVQDLALQIARLSQAVEPLVRVQEEQGRIRERVGELEGFRAAVIWFLGFIVTTTLIKYGLQIWTGGK